MVICDAGGTHRVFAPRLPCLFSCFASVSWFRVLSLFFSVVRVYNDPQVVVVVSASLLPRVPMVSAEVKARVLQYWRDPAFGLTGLRRFQDKLRARGLRLRVAEIRDIVQSDPAHHLFSYNPQARVWNTITETGVGEGMQMDLMDMEKLATRNANFSWILCIIDVYSRYAWAFKIKRKTQTCVYHCLKGWLASLSKPPKRLTSDAGKEFTNTQVRQLL